jgi:hypothetical protein
MPYVKRPAMTHRMRHTMETKPEYKTGALVPYQPLTPSIWQMIMAVAEPIHKSRLFGTSSPEQAAATMLKGYEMGLSLTSSFELIHVIQGKAGLSPRGALALIQQSPLCAKLEIEDIQDDQGNPWACTVTMERTNGFSYTSTVTMADAQRAGLVKKGSGWENWPANMLRWRAVGFCADVVFPDVIGGMKRTDELGADLDQGGEIVDAAQDDPWSIIAKDPEPRVDMGYLVDNWGTDLVLEANGGKVPGADEIPDLLEKLREQYPRDEVF